MDSKNFTDCDLTFLEDTFGLRRTFTNTKPLLDWLQAPQTISERERFFAEDLREMLILNVEGWHEQDLSMHFIGPIFSIIKFTEPYRYNLFSERYISAVINGYELKGNPDELIASGYREPKVPFFAFNEYKKEKDPNGDPISQCLAAMLVGQTLNKSANMPIYGCYVIGQNWYFMVLLSNEYAISPSYSAATDEVFDIVRILKTLKQLVAIRTADV